MLQNYTRFHANGIFLTELIQSSDPMATSEQFRVAMYDELNGLWRRRIFEDVAKEYANQNANVIPSIFVLFLKDVM